MPGGGTGLGAEVRDAAGELAPFGPEIAVLDLELADGILRRNDNRQVDIADVQGLAIKVLRTLIGERTSDLVIAPTEWVLAYWRTTGSSLRNCRRGNYDQIEDIPAVQR